MPSAQITASPRTVAAQEWPLVSIVTPSYNHGLYIEATIQSVLQQDYANLEYIVIDGGSQDDTVQILERYADRLCWISEPDRGQADAINKGFRMARGEILAWLNSDDTYLPGAVRQAVEYFQKHPDTSMVYGEGQHVDAAGQIIEPYTTEPFDYQRLSERCFICQPTVFFRAHVFRDIGPLDTTLHYCLDYEYWMRIAKRFRIGHLDASLATSRLHMDTKTLSGLVAAHDESLRVVQHHFGRVPARWLYAYAAAYLTEKFLPNLQGMYRDGWARPRVRVFLRDPRQRYAYLSVQGTTSQYARPLPLRITAGDQVLYEAIIAEPSFCLQVPFGQPDRTQHGAAALEINIHAEKSFTPCAIGLNDDPRPASYHCRKLSLVAEDGRECVVYSARKAALLLSLLPVVFVWKALRVNHSVPLHEMWQQGWKLWRSLKKRTL
jgi:glycosyltransferase involved in cell wall biosynthesis